MKYLFTLCALCPVEEVVAENSYIYGFAEDHKFFTSEQGAQDIRLLAFVSGNASLLASIEVEVPTISVNIKKTQFGDTLKELLPAIINGREVFYVEQPFFEPEDEVYCGKINFYDEEIKLCRVSDIYCSNML